MRTRAGALTLVTILSAISGCAAQNEYASWRAASEETVPEACSAQISGVVPLRRTYLKSGDIKVVNWNIQKGSDPEWIADLTEFSNQPDIMIFQEASPNMDEWDKIGSGHFRSFAPGYRTPGTSGSVTGVMTLSTAEPLTQCSLISVEPWLRSPKATMITEYGLSDTDRTLLVVNIHAINFTFGNKRYREQILRALSVIDDHDGPVLLSGDFNTWHSKRSGILRALVIERGMTMLNYDDDFRKRAFGQPLDHIYVRGLQVLDATTSQSDSSDHNPMSATLTL